MVLGVVTADVKRLKEGRTMEPHQHHQAHPGTTASRQNLGDRGNHPNVTTNSNPSRSTAPHAQLVIPHRFADVEAHHGYDAAVAGAEVWSPPSSRGSSRDGATSTKRPGGLIARKKTTTTSPSPSRRPNGKSLPPPYRMSSRVSGGGTTRGDVNAEDEGVMASIQGEEYYQHRRPVLLSAGHKKEELHRDHHHDDLPEEDVLYEYGVEEVDPATQLLLLKMQRTQLGGWNTKLGSGGTTDGNGTAGTGGEHHGGPSIAQDPKQRQAAQFKQSLVNRQRAEEVGANPNDLGESSSHHHHPHHLLFATTSSSGTVGDNASSSPSSNTMGKFARQSTNSSSDRGGEVGVKMNLSVQSEDSDDDDATSSDGNSSHPLSIQTPPLSSTKRTDSSYTVSLTTSGSGWPTSASRQQQQSTLQVRAHVSTGSSPPRGTHHDAIETQLDPREHIVLQQRERHSIDLGRLLGKAISPGKKNGHHGAGGDEGRALVMAMIPTMTSLQEELDADAAANGKHTKKATHLHRPSITFDAEGHAKMPILKSRKSLVEAILDGVADEEAKKEQFRRDRDSQVFKSDEELQLERDRDQQFHRIMQERQLEKAEGTSGQFVMEDADDVVVGGDADIDDDGEEIPRSPQKGAARLSNSQEAKRISDEDFKSKTAFQTSSSNSSGGVGAVVALTKENSKTLPMKAGGLPSTANGQGTRKKKQPKSLVDDILWKQTYFEYKKPDVIVPTLPTPPSPPKQQQPLRDPQTDNARCSIGGRMEEPSTARRPPKPPSLLPSTGAMMATTPTSAEYGGAQPAVSQQRRHSPEQQQGYYTPRGTHSGHTAGSSTHHRSGQLTSSGASPMKSLLQQAKPTMTHVKLFPNTPEGERSKAIIEDPSSKHQQEQKGMKPPQPPRKRGGSGGVGRQATSNSSTPAETVDWGGAEGANVSTQTFTPTAQQTSPVEHDSSASAWPSQRTSPMKGGHGSGSFSPDQQPPSRLMSGLNSKRTSLVDRASFHDSFEEQVDKQAKRRMREGRAEIQRLHLAKAAKEKKERDSDERQRQFARRRQSMVSGGSMRSRPSSGNDGGLELDLSSSSAILLPLLSESDGVASGTSPPRGRKRGGAAGTKNSQSPSKTGQRKGRQQEKTVDESPSHDVRGIVTNVLHNVVGKLKNSPALQRDPEEEARLRSLRSPRYMTPLNKQTRRKAKEEGSLTVPTQPPPTSANPVFQVMTDRTSPLHPLSSTGTGETLVPKPPPHSGEQSGQHQQELATTSTAVVVASSPTRLQQETMTPSKRRARIQAQEKGHDFAMSLVRRATSHSITAPLASAGRTAMPGTCRPSYSSRLNIACCNNALSRSAESTLEDILLPELQYVHPPRTAAYGSEAPTGSARRVLAAEAKKERQRKQNKRSSNPNETIERETTSLEDIQNICAEAVQQRHINKARLQEEEEAQQREEERLQREKLIARRKTRSIHHHGHGHNHGGGGTTNPHHSSTSIHPLEEGGFASGEFGGSGSMSLMCGSDLAPHPPPQLLGGP